MFHPTTATLVRYLENDLAESRANKTSSHINKCASCRKRVAFLNGIEEARKPKRVLPEDFNARLLAGLKECKRSKQPIVAEVQSIIGNVLVERNGNHCVEAFPAMGLKKGFGLKLDEKSMALLELTDGSSIWLNKATEINFPTRNYNLSLLAGELFAMMKPQRKTFEIKTPSAVLGVIGTDFDAEIGEKNETTLKVLKGKVSFKNNSGSATVKKKHQVSATKHRAPVPTRLKSTTSIGNWTSMTNVIKSERGSSMKKLIIGLVAIVLLVAGYLLYQGDFADEAGVSAPVLATPATLSVDIEPGFVAEENRMASGCVGNLLMFLGAKEQHALRQNLSDGANVRMEDLVGETRYIRRMPVCPAGGTYSLNAIGDPPTCSHVSPAGLVQHSLATGYVLLDVDTSEGAIDKDIQEATEAFLKFQELVRNRDFEGMVDIWDLEVERVRTNLMHRKSLDIDTVRDYQLRMSKIMPSKVYDKIAALRIESAELENSFPEDYFRDTQVEFTGPIVKMKLGEWTSMVRKTSDGWKVFDFSPANVRGETPKEIRELLEPMEEALRSVLIEFGLTQEWPDDVPRPIGPADSTR